MLKHLRLERLSRWQDPLLVALLLFTWLKIAWAADDAYIYFRSVEMWYAGYGPVYNPGWRVQAFTSPLWYVLLLWARAWISDLYLAAQMLSLALSGLLWWLLRRWAHRPALRWLTGLALMSSIGFFDFTSSGLETPLVYLLLALFLLAWEAERPWLVVHAFAWFALARYDVAVFLTGLPTLQALRQAWQQASWQVFFRKLILALAPLLAWLLFAVVYYGTPLPNPVYAKVFAGLPRSQVLRQGLLYFLANLQLDPWTLLAILAGLVAWAGFPQGRVWAWSLALYLAYLVGVGGDFMVGRFLAPAFLVAWVGLLYRARHLPKPPLRWAMAGLVLYNVVAPHTPLKSPVIHRVPWKLYYGVIDERGFYHAASSLFTFVQCHWKWPACPAFPADIQSFQGLAVRSGPLQVAIVNTVGMFGYWAGPEKTVVDVLALTDPFLARLPVKTDADWRPGHIERDIPSGYLLTLLTKRSHLTNPSLECLWERVYIVTQDSLWSWRRLRALSGYMFNSPCTFQGPP